MRTNCGGCHAHSQAPLDQGNVTRVARRFSVGATVVFADGFESGDVGAWTGSAGG